MILTLLLHTLKSYQRDTKKHIFCKKVCQFPATYHFLLGNSFNVQGVALVLPPQKQLIKPRFFGMDFFVRAPGIRSEVIKGTTKNPNPKPTCQNSWESKGVTSPHLPEETTGLLKWFFTTMIPTAGWHKWKITKPTNTQVVETEPDRFF